MAVVLKQFPWSPDGHTVEILNAGDERNFGTAFGGLRDEGFVAGEAEAVVTPATEPVVASTEPVVEPAAAEPTADPAPSMPAATVPATSRKRK